MDEKYAFLVIYKSENGRDGWVPVEKKDVPAWVLERRTMGRMMAGEACMKADEGETGSAWYRAQPVKPPRVTH